MSRTGKIIALFFSICISTSLSYSKEIEFLDPVIVAQSNSDYSENQFSPNLLFDNDGYLLTYHINGIDGCNLRTIRLVSEPQFFTTSENFLFDSSTSPISPTMQKIENKKILFYNKQQAIENTYDTLFQQRLLLYHNDIPNYIDFQTGHTFYTLPKSNHLKPQFLKSVNRIYSLATEDESVNQTNNDNQFFLRSLDYLTSELFPPILHFTANGNTAMVNYGDSILIVKSWIFCTDYKNLECVEWETGYKAYVVYENKIESIHALSSQTIDDPNTLPDDIFVGLLNGENVFALRQSNYLKRINLLTMRFENILDLSAHSNNTFTKIDMIQTVDYAVLILIDENNNGTIMRFDSEYQFVDSISIPFEGAMTEISDFVYDPSQDMLSYAYATKLYEDNSPSRIFLQSVLFDKELIFHPPPELPYSFMLAQNYPNPFNPKTTIKYTIPHNGHLRIDVYNLLGQKVSTLYDNNQTAGEHLVDWDANNKSSGIYLVRVSFDDQTKSIKTMLLK